MNSTYTAEDWADQISALLATATLDGHEVYIGNDCCGCSAMDLYIIADKPLDQTVREVKISW